MGRKSHKFYPQNYNHVYNIADDKGVIFYCIKDYLVFLSMIYHYSKVYKISIVSMCIMVNHFHILSKPSSLDALRNFVMSTTGHFSKIYNAHYGRKGKLFKKPFGFSQKYGAKQVRTTISYVLNNPVEKKLVKAVEDYRWNFIAYANSSCPYSKQILIRESSSLLRKAIKSFNSYRLNNNYLSYEYLDILFRGLGKEEREQLIDFIISSYKCVDYNSCLDFYEGNYKQLLRATNSNTGSDPNTPEAFDRCNDVPYKYFYSEINKLGYDWEDVVFRMDRHSKEFTALVDALVCKISGLPEHFNRFLHLGT